MSLRFFADHCVPRSVVVALQDQGHGVIRLVEQLPCNATDPTVLSQAQKLDAVLLSMNGDFADLVKYPPDKYGGIIALQVRNHPRVLPAMLRILRAFLASHPHRSFYRGKLFLVEPHRIRVRP